VSPKRPEITKWRGKLISGVLIVLPELFTTEYNETFAGLDPPIFQITMPLHHSGKYRKSSVKQEG
jgi:hypothetical protein